VGPNWTSITTTLDCPEQDFPRPCAERLALLLGHCLKLLGFVFQETDIQLGASALSRNERRTAHSLGTFFLEKLDSRIIHLLISGT
jgi:hypothetical protein